MLTFLVLHITETFIEAQNDLHFICGNTFFSGKTGSYACFSKLPCKCNFSSLLLWPSCCCLGFLPLEGRSFSTIVLFQQIQGTLHFRDTLLTHSHTAILASSQSGAGLRGHQGARALPILSGWLAQTYTLSSYESKKCVCKAPIPWMQTYFMLVQVTMLFSYAFLPVPLPLVLLLHFLGQEQGFTFLFWLLHQHLQKCRITEVRISSCGQWVTAMLSFWQASIIPATSTGEKTHTHAAFSCPWQPEHLSDILLHLLTQPISAHCNQMQLIGRWWQPRDCWICMLTPLFYRHTAKLQVKWDRALHSRLVPVFSTSHAHA